MRGRDGHGHIGRLGAGEPAPRAEAPFVCPVLTLNENAVDNSGRFKEIGDGQYTFAPGAAGSAETFNGNVPNHATNQEALGPQGERIRPPVTRTTRRSGAETPARVGYGTLG